MLAVPRRDPALGFAAFSARNIGWQTFSAQCRQWGLFAQQVAFLIISAAGIWNWWFGLLMRGIVMNNDRIQHFLSRLGAQQYPERLPTWRKVRDQQTPLLLVDFGTRHQMLNGSGLDFARLQRVAAQTPLANTSACFSKNCSISFAMCSSSLPHLAVAAKGLGGASPGWRRWARSFRGRNAVRGAYSDALRCAQEGTPMEQREPVFAAMNEADVREEVIAPLIKHLGYRTGTEHNVIRELNLSYSQVQLGRQKASDPPLRGKADYLLEAGRRVRWVIEAKAPACPLDAAVEAQAWSYANHPEVRAVYFLVTNGREFRLYATNRGPDGRPLLQFAYEEIQARMLAIRNTLGPDGMLQAFPDVQIDEGEPLGPGLRSTARISSGRLKTKTMSPRVAPVDLMTTSVVDGVATRRPGGGIAVTYRTEVAVTPLQAFNEQIGLNLVELTSAEEFLSTNQLHPSVFHGSLSFLVPKGTSVLDINTWDQSEAPVDIRGEVEIEATGHLDGQDFAGVFRSSMRMTLDVPDLGMQQIEFESTGTFLLNLV